MRGPGRARDEGLAKEDPEGTADPCCKDPFGWGAGRSNRRMRKKRLSGPMSVGPMQGGVGRRIVGGRAHGLVVALRAGDADARTWRFGSMDGGRGAPAGGGRRGWIGLGHGVSRAGHRRAGMAGAGHDVACGVGRGDRRGVPAGLHGGAGAGHGLAALAAQHAAPGRGDGGLACVVWLLRIVPGAMARMGSMGPRRGTCAAAVAGGGRGACIPGLATSDVGAVGRGDRLGGDRVAPGAGSSRASHGTRWGCRNGGRYPWCSSPASRACTG